MSYTKILLDTSQETVGIVKVIIINVAGTIQHSCWINPSNYPKFSRESLGLLLEPAMRDWPHLLIKNTGDMVANQTIYATRYGIAGTKCVLGCFPSAVGLCRSLSELIVEERHILSKFYHSASIVTHASASLLHLQSVYLESFTTLPMIIQAGAHALLYEAVRLDAALVAKNLARPAAFAFVGPPTKPLPIVAVGIIFGIICWSGRSGFKKLNTKVVDFLSPQNYLSSSFGILLLH